MLSPFTSLSRKLAGFKAASHGNVTILFALSMIPVFGLVGAAVDYSRANSARSAMQAAVDATALMLSKDVAELSSSERSKKATDYFTALFNRTEVADITLTPVYTPSPNFQIVLSATGAVPTTFSKVIGFQKLNVSVSSTVDWGNKRLRVALVLDNTGSMSSSNKMTALKTAAKDLLDKLRSAAKQNGDVYVSIIPFAKDVNVDKTNYTQPWVRWNSWDGANGQWCKSNGQCGATQSGNAVWTPNSHATWNGCVTDRDQDYDTKNTAPSASTPATLFPAEQYANCPVAMMGLSYDWAALNSKIDEMQPAGNTNQAIGLQWGFQSLTSTPFTIPPLDPNYKYQQVIILLTDGLNTQNRWTSDQATIDARQTITCNDVKAAGIVLYTVQVNTNGDPTSTMLQNCASPDSVDPKGPKFFLLTSATEIVSTFNQIGTSLSALRVAR